MSKRWLYALVAVLALALAFETGYLLKSRNAGRPASDPYPVRASAAPGVPGPSAPRIAAPVTRSAHAWTLAPSVFDEVWDPFSEMDRMRREMDRLFQDGSNRLARFGGARGLPSYDPDLDFRETPKEYVVRLDLPGIEKDKIDVKVKNGTLVVSGRRETEAEDEGEEGGYYRMERSFGSFTRSFPLPADASSEGMTAEAKNGVLTVRIPRVPDKKSADHSVGVR